MHTYKELALPVASLLTLQKADCLFGIQEEEGPASGVDVDAARGSGMEGSARLHMEILEDGTASNRTLSFEAEDSVHDLILKQQTEVNHWYLSAPLCWFPTKPGNRK